MLRTAIPKCVTPCIMQAWKRSFEELIIGNGASCLDFNDKSRVFMVGVRLKPLLKLPVYPK